MREKRSRLDEEMARRGVAGSRSQALRLIRLGRVKVDRVLATKPHQSVTAHSNISVKNDETYVSRAGFKLAAAARTMNINFKNKVVLDVGSSTGGFSDYALQHGAKKIIAVDVGSRQMHPSLRRNPLIELHENTDIRDMTGLSDPPDIICIDVSFISLRQIIPAVAKLATPDTLIIALLKPQFEAGKEQLNKGIVKNDTIRRAVLRSFERWVKKYCLIIDKTDSEVAGSKGNLERFYKLVIIKS